MPDKVEQTKMILEQIFLMPVEAGDAEKVLERIEALRDSAAELLRAPAEPEQTCPSCNGLGIARDIDSIFRACDACNGTGKSNRSGRG